MWLLSNKICQSIGNTSMATSSTQFATSRRMGVYDPLHQISMWEATLAGDISPNTGTSSILLVDGILDNKYEYTSHESAGHSVKYQAIKTNSDKSQRRLAQNREAARKFRLRKKAYVQQLETSRLKLAQLEQKAERARQHGVCTGGALTTGNLGFGGTKNSGIVTFEVQYGLWVEVQRKKNSELRNVLQANISDIELRRFVQSGLNHYNDLFRMKADAAKADIFYLMSGVWRTSVERVFLWIGGFRPSELLNVLMPQIEQLTDQQLSNVVNLQNSCQQAEYALLQGMDKLQKNISQSIIDNAAGDGSYDMAAAMEKLEALEDLVKQADHLRQQTLQHMYSILTTRQAARGLLTLGDYFQRLRALTRLWAARSCQPG